MASMPSKAESRAMCLLLLVVGGTCKFALDMAKLSGNKNAEQAMDVVLAIIAVLMGLSGGAVVHHFANDQTTGNYYSSLFAYLCALTCAICYLAVASATIDANDEAKKWASGVGTTLGFLSVVIGSLSVWLRA